MCFMLLLCSSLPVSSQLKSASPIPTGAMKFPTCFSAANMKIVKTRTEVRSISIITPCAIVVVSDRVVATLRSPVNSACTTYHYMLAESRGLYGDLIVSYKCCDYGSDHLRDEQQNRTSNRDSFDECHSESDLCAKVSRSAEKRT